jgi:hypothetical protein
MVGSSDMSAAPHQMSRPWPLRLPSRPARKGGSRRLLTNPTAWTGSVTVLSMLVFVRTNPTARTAFMLAA